MPEHSRRPRVRAPTPRAAGATSASETLYRGLVEDQTELVSLATPGGELTFVNRAYARWHGLRADEMVGRSLLEFVPEPDRAAVAEHLRRVCEVRESLEAENQVTRPNGETCWFAWTNRALFDAAGRVTAIHSVGRDIEWRVAAEQRVRQSEARFRLLAENSIDMILLVDRDGKRVYVSPSCRPMLGFEPEEMLRLNTREALHPDDAPRVLERLARSGEDSDTLVYRMRRKDGGICLGREPRATVRRRTGANAATAASGARHRAARRDGKPAARERSPISAAGGHQLRHGVSARPRPVARLRVAGLSRNHRL
jgi:PAS domain S-box-containing protein